MNLLLTSSGVENAVLRRALRTALGGQCNATRAVFITTAANVESGDRSWLDRNINEIWSLGCKAFECIDIASPIEEWRRSLCLADIIVVGGGNTFYLMSIMRRVGFMSLLEKSVATVYVGISAGSVVCGQTIQFALDTNDVGVSDMRGFGFIDGVVLPHWSDKKQRRLETLPCFTKIRKYPLADGQGLQVMGETIREIK